MLQWQKAAVVYYRNNKQTDPFQKMDHKKDIFSNFPNENMCRQIIRWFKMLFFRCFRRVPQRVVCLCWKCDFCLQIKSFPCAIVYQKVFPVFDLFERMVFVCIIWHFRHHQEQLRATFFFVYKNFAVIYFYLTKKNELSPCENKGKTNIKKFFILFLSFFYISKIIKICGAKQTKRKQK